MRHDSAAVTVSCPAPVGAGGLGRHASELIGGLRDAGNRVSIYGPAAAEGEPDVTIVGRSWLSWICRIPPMRFRRDWQTELEWSAFDQQVARSLRRGDVLHAFAGAALRTFRAARCRGYSQLCLESPTSHVRHVRRRYDSANRVRQIERDWLGAGLLARTLAEYETADVICVNSELARETFLAEGVPAHKLRRRRLTVDARYRPPTQRPANSGLHVVYVGSLTVSKGVPILIEAFARFDDPTARLTLVGSTGTRGMRRYIDVAQSRDPRVRVAPGDPLPHFHSADVCVHPSYSDGFGYAPMEALACGLPVIVSDDTGMKESIREGRDGFVVPTGDADVILERLQFLSRNRSGNRG